MAMRIALGNKPLVAQMCGALIWCALLLSGCASPGSPMAAPSPIASPASPTPVADEAAAWPLAQSLNGAEFTSISLEQGLSQSVVNDILQDSQGFMWFATQDGLNRYDGYEFVVYKHDPANPATLSDNFAQVLHEDRGGDLWIGTHTGGLNRFDPNTRQFTVYRHNPDDPTTLSHSNILAITESRDGQLWIGTAAGLNRLDPSTGEIVRYPHDDDSGKPTAMQDDKEQAVISGISVHAVIEDREGMIWAGTFRGGLNRLDPRTGQVEVYRMDEADPAGLPDDNVTALLEDRAGDLWIGTSSGGLARLDRATSKFVRYQHDPDDETSLAGPCVTALLEDRAGNLWIGADNDGLDRYDRATGQFIHHRPRPDEPHSLNNPTVQALYEDRGGVLWVGTFGGGANKYDPSARKFVHYRHDPEDPNSLSSNLVWSFAEDQDGAIWIGTIGAGLNRFDLTTGVFTRYRTAPGDPSSLSDDQVWTVHVDRTGELWVGTAIGLDRYNRNTGAFTHIVAPSVFDIEEDQRGELWLATNGGGLGRVDRDLGEIIYYRNDPANPSSISGNFLTNMYEDRDGRLWVGTFDSGMARLDDPTADPAAAQFARFRNNPEDPTSLINDTVLDIHQDHTGVMWAATAGGLDRLNSATGGFTHYGVKDGLPNEVIYAVLEDDAGNLWLSTNRGLARFAPQTEAIRNYAPRDGLQSAEFNQGAALRTRNGVMYFGGINGFNSFDPAAVRDRLYAPAIRLTQFALFNEPAPIAEDSPLAQAIERTDAITLSRAQDFFSFEFAALDYAAPELIQYAYMMEGLDHDWNYVGNRRFAGYTNVPPGEYTFRVKATNSDGQWSEMGAPLGVTVTPPFWQTWWFQIGAALALFGSITAAYRLRVRGVEARSRELEDQVAKRTREIERRRQELAALYRADEELYSHLSVDRVLAALAEIAVHILNADRSAVMTWDETLERPVVRVAHGLSPEDLSVLALPNGVAAEVGRTGQPIIIADVEAETGLAPTGVRSAMHLPIRINEEIFGVFCVGYNTPHAFTADEQRLFTALTHRAALAIENARHFDQEHRRAEQFHLISEVGQRMNAILAPDDLLQQLATLIREAFDCSNVAIGFIEEGEVVTQVECGVPDRVPRGLRVSVGHDGVWGWVAQTGEPLLVNDLQSVDRPAAAGANTFPSQICAPLISKNGTIGVLSIADNQPNQFDDEDVMVLQALANQAATAIENARLYEQAQQIAVLEERSRLARDLHDAVTQTLFSASLIAEALPAIWRADRREGESLLTELRQLSRGALAEMRTLLLELRPAALTDAALPDLLRQLAEAATGRIGAPVEVEVEGGCALSEQERVTLYRIAQEALNNVAKHAEAGRVSVSLSSHPRPADPSNAVIVLQICDDGRGFDPAAVSPDHLGLGIIRERAEAIGAQLEIASQPGGGTVVSVRLDAPPEPIPAVA